MSQPEPLTDEEQELLAQTSEDIENTLKFRDEVMTGRESTKRRIFAPPNIDGATLLFSRYGFRDTGVLRVVDAVCVE